MEENNSLQLGCVSVDLESRTTKHSRVKKPIFNIPESDINI